MFYFPFNFLIYIWPLSKHFSNAFIKIKEFFWSATLDYLSFKNYMQDFSNECLIWKMRKWIEWFFFQFFWESFIKVSKTITDVKSAIDFMFREHISLMMLYPNFHISVFLKKVCQSLLWNIGLSSEVNFKITEKLYISWTHSLLIVFLLCTISLIYTSIIWVIWSIPYVIIRKDPGF